MAPLIAAALMAGAVQWTAAWASAQMPVDAKYELKDAGDLSLRQIVRVTAAGQQARVRLSNAFGTTPLVVLKAAVAPAQKPGSAALAGDSHALTFGGQISVTLAPGQEIVSDPVDLPVRAFDDLAVSLYRAAAPEPQTGHVAAHATAFRIGGDHVADADLSGAATYESWFALSEIDVLSPAAGAVAVLGDSITDGTASATDANARWTDDLARRLRDDGQAVAVVNLGIGGNCLLRRCHGPAGLDRLDRDVFARDHVRWLIVAEGINDLGRATKDGGLTPRGHADLVRKLEDGYRSVIAQGHAHGLKVIGATLTPDGASPLYHPDAAAEADRQALNTWIRNGGAFDGVIDFDAAVRDPADPARLQPAYDSGDHLHPGPGYAVMAAVIDLNLFSDRK